MNRRIAAALACSLALHILLAASLRSGGGLSPRTSWADGLQVTLQSPPAPAVAESPVLPAPQQAPPLPSSAPVGPQEAPLPPVITAEERYLLPVEVDVRAQPIDMAVLVYPEKAYQMKVGGLVRLRVYLSESGRIDAVDVVEATPPGVFEDAALKALLATTFTPAQKDGRNVKSQKLIEINLDPDENTRLP